MEDEILEKEKCLSSASVQFSLSDCQFCQSCLTLCDPVNHSTPVMLNRVMLASIVFRCAAKIHPKF